MNTAEGADVQQVLRTGTAQTTLRGALSGNAQERPSSPADSRSAEAFDLQLAGQLPGIQTANRAGHYPLQRIPIRNQQDGETGKLPGNATPAALPAPAASSQTGRELEDTSVADPAAAMLQSVGQGIAGSNAPVGESVGRHLDAGDSPGAVRRTGVTLPPGSTSLHAQNADASGTSGMSPGRASMLRERGSTTDHAIDSNAGRTDGDARLAASDKRHARPVAVNLATAASRPMGTPVGVPLAHGPIEHDHIRSIRVPATSVPDKNTVARTESTSGTASSPRAALGAVLGAALRVTNPIGAESLPRLGGNGLDLSVPERGGSALDLQRSGTPVQGASSAQVATVAQAEMSTGTKTSTPDMRSRQPTAAVIAASASAERAGSDLATDNRENSRPLAATPHVEATTGQAMRTEPSLSGQRVAESLPEEVKFPVSLRSGHTIANPSATQETSELALSLFRITPGGTLAPAAPGAMSQAMPSEATSSSAAQAPQSIPIFAPQAARLLGENLRWMVGENLRTASFAMSPAGMGPVSVKLGLDRDSLQISIIAPQGTTRDALDALLPRLRETLASAGYSDVDVDVSDRRQGRDEFGREQHHGTESASTTPSGSIDTDSATTDANARTDRYAYRHQGLFNITV